MAYSIYIKHMFTTVGCFEDAILLQLPGLNFFLCAKQTNKQTTVQAEVSILHGL